MSRHSVPSFADRVAAPSRRRASMRIGCALLACAGLLTSVAAHPAPAQLRGRVRFGMSTALTGPAADLGLEVRAGVRAAFAHWNAIGGVQGRQLELVDMDDGYEPARTVPNMQALVDDPSVIGIVGNVGTPTAVVAVPIALKAQIPFVGAFTGAGVLRKEPPDAYVFNFRASYVEETESAVDAFVREARIDVSQIALFAQRDAYGDAGCAGAIAAMKRRGLKDESDVVIGTYERNSLAVESALADILLAPTTPKAVILVGAYAPCAKFIRLAKEHGLDALFVNVSFVGSASLARELGAVGDGTLITQVLPPFAGDLPLAREFRADLERTEPGRAPSYVSFEGYAVGRIVARAVASIPGEPTRESLKGALEALGTFDLGLGFPLRLDTEHHQASSRVFPTVLQGGAVVPFDWSALRPLPSGG